MSNISSHSGLKPELVQKVNQLEQSLGANFWISSGYRTQEYNAKVGGATNSQHLYGRAVDIARSSFRQSPEELMQTALQLGFTGIGFYDKHIHLDIRTDPHARGYSFWDNRTGKGAYDQQEERTTDDDHVEIPIKNDDVLKFKTEGDGPALLVMGASALFLLNLLDS